MKKNKAFTLIELIGVVTLLSLIVLVSVPVIINTMNRSEQKEYDHFKKIVENAAELYLERNRNLYPDFNEIGDSIDINAEILIQEGYLNNDLENPINHTNVSKYKVVVTYGQDEIFEYKTLKRMVFAELATTTDEVPNVNACALSGTCEIGTKFAIQVNENDIYNFYVIADDGNDVTLIIDRNLGDNVAWINAEDYAEANIDNTFCSSNACTDEGPITTLKALQSRTYNWTNISEREYTYSDDGDGNMYEDFTVTMRSRMLTYTEIKSFECISGHSSICPSWLYDNGNGYWTTAVINSNAAWYFYKNCSYRPAEDVSSGIRPVITVSRILY